MYKARSYNLVEDIFIEHAKGKVNITNAWNLIELEEDLFNPSMSCFLTVGDTTGLLDDIDFDGTETFKILVPNLIPSLLVLSFILKNFLLNI